MIAKILRQHTHSRTCRAHTYPLMQTNIKIASNSLALARATASCVESTDSSCQGSSNNAQPKTNQTAYSVALLRPFEGRGCTFTIFVSLSRVCLNRAFLDWIAISLSCIVFLFCVKVAFVSTTWLESFERRTSTCLP
jgi:hypothetical protein